MAGETGKYGIIMFTTSNVYDKDDCLQGSDVSDSVNDVVYQCNGYDKHVAGTRSLSLRFSMALPAANMNAVMAVLYAGAHCTRFIYMPSGYTTASASRLKYTCTDATVMRSDVGAPINGIVTLDGEIALSDITVGAATSV